MALQPQPDFGVISDGFGLLAQQFQRCANLPAVDQGNRLVEALEALQRDMTALREDVRRIEHKLDTSDVNGTARIVNTTVTRNDTRLEPLRAITTGQEIPHFPHTVSDIARMQSATLNTVLEALGKPTTGTVAEKRRRLMTAIGVVVQQV